MKIWCETCEGKGHEINMIHSGEDMHEGRIECIDCDGKGYTENKELERLARIGEATEKVFKQNVFIHGLWWRKTVNSVDKLLEWAEDMKEV